MSNVTVNNVNGMGQVLLPTETEFGSGDLPIGNTILSYSDFIRKYSTDDFDDRDEDDDNLFKITEKSAFDQISNKSAQKSDPRKLASFVKNQRTSYATWYKRKHTAYIAKLKSLKEKIDTTEGKDPQIKQQMKDLIIKHKTEVRAKKIAMSNKLKKYRKK